MTALWLVMGVLVSIGFYFEARDDQERCQSGNTFRREDLPMAFDEFGQFLGSELGADPAEVEDARARFAVVMDDLFPERECPLW